MTIRTSPWPAGVPCWADLSSPDQDASKAFYSAVLGWDFPPVEGEFAEYVIGERKGAPAAGIGPKFDPSQPTVWTLYLASDDADKTAATVTEHGGTVLVPPGDVGPMGRMFIAADPTGAVFGVWQAGTHIGASLVNEPGGITWEDLRSPDPDAARAFYTAVFGYDTEPVPMAGPDYTTFHSPGSEAPLGGMGGQMGMTGMPAHWLVYFSVEDADAAIAAAESHGGSAIMPPMDTPYGRMAGIADPHGAMFWVTQLVQETPGSGD
jgi:predicted enzyme related to lactoylglutathione lyase